VRNETIRLRMPNAKKPRQNTVLGEYRSATRPQKSRKAAKVTPKAVWHQPRPARQKVTNHNPGLLLEDDVEVAGDGREEDVEHAHAEDCRSATVEQQVFHGAWTQSVSRYAPSMNTPRQNNASRHHFLD
jgi:hypothetical protein